MRMNEGTSKCFELLGEKDDKNPPELQCVYPSLSLKSAPSPVTISQASASLE